MAKVCGFWECAIEVRQDWTVCQDHYGDFADGKLDVCPGCGWLKSKQYDLCLACHEGKEPPKGRTINSRPNRDRIAERRTGYEVPPPGAPAEIDISAGGVHVYILKLTDGEFYVGHSEDLESRLMEHRDGKVQSTTGRSPTLVWFDWVPTKAQAIAVEAEMKQINADNPRRIRRMVIAFSQLARQVDTNP